MFGHSAHHVQVGCWTDRQKQELQKLGHCIIGSGADKREQLRGGVLTVVCYEIVQQLLQLVGIRFLLNHKYPTILQGVEVYKGKPIIYSAGSLIDDYAIDDDYRNDLGKLGKIADRYYWGCASL